MRMYLRNACFVCLAGALFACDEASDACTGDDCAASCPAPMAVCPEVTGDECVDLTTDVSHCGACNASCAADDRCDQGVCEPAACILNAWSSAKVLTVENPGDTLIDYTMQVTVDTATLIAAGKMNADCSDLRFASMVSPPLPSSPSSSFESYGGGEELSYWLESGCNTDKTVIWVRVPSILQGQDELVMLYGNPSAPPASNGRKTFPFFEDFDNLRSLAWDESIRGYDELSHVYDNSFDASDYGSQGYTLRLLSGDVVCTTEAQGMILMMETYVGLPAADYCIELEAKAEVFDFLYITSGTTSLTVALDGAPIVSENVSCEGVLCRADTGWRSYRVFYPRRTIHTMSLSVQNGDCATSAAQFNDIRVFRCAAEEPQVSFGEEIFCRPRESRPG